MKITAPAKINLTLEVMAAREDGYHPLRSVMVPLALADEISIQPSERFAFTCSDPQLEGEDNLVVRAVRSVDPGAKIAVRLEKRVPSQAGLGGGSSDAAAMLIAAMEGAFAAPPGTDWLRIARSLGSDVPFFLTGTGALVEGTGERVTAAGSLPHWHVIVIKPPAAVSTASAYRLLDETGRPTRPRNTSVSLVMLAALQRGDFDTVEATLQNDFHDAIAAHVPDVARAVDALRRAGARSPMLSGSGSAVFALERTAAEIAAIAQHLDLPASYQVIATSFAPARGWRSELAI